MAYWLFQGNPKYYRVQEAIANFEQMPWLVTRYAKEINVDDKVLIWISGQNAGIYATAKITESPKMWKEIPDRAYWLDPSRLGTKPQAQLCFTRKLLETPLLKKDLKQDSILKDLLVIRAPNSTNFKVAPQQWQRVQQLIG